MLFSPSLQHNSSLPNKQKSAVRGEYPVGFSIKTDGIGEVLDGVTVFGNAFVTQKMGAVRGGKTKLILGKEGEEKHAVGRKSDITVRPSKGVYPHFIGTTVHRIGTQQQVSGAKGGLFGIIFRLACKKKGQ